MNQYQIDLKKIVKWLKNRKKELKNKEGVGGIIKAFQHILDRENFNHPPVLFQKGWVVSVAVKSKDYPASLAIWLLMTDPLKHQKILEYHKKRFTQNELKPLFPLLSY